MESWREELYHHGILGQKWGVRNGDSYPLKPEQHSSAEKKHISLNFGKINVNVGGETRGESSISNYGNGSGAYVDPNEDKELLNYLSELTGMTTEAIAELIAEYRKSGGNSDKFNKLMSDISEGDMRIARSIASVMQKYDAEKEKRKSSNTRAKVNAKDSEKAESKLKINATTGQSKRISDAMDEYNSSKDLNKSIGIKTKDNGQTKRIADNKAEEKAAKNFNRTISNGYKKAKDWVEDQFDEMSQKLSTLDTKNGFEKAADWIEEKITDVGYDLYKLTRPNDTFQDKVVNQLDDWSYEINKKFR